MKVLPSNVRFDFLGFTLREESIIVTALVNIGACGAVHAVAPKRTGRLPGIVAIISLWQLLGCKKNSAYGGKLLLGGLLKHFYNVLGSRGRRSLRIMCATLGNVGLYVITKGVVSVRVGSFSLYTAHQHEEYLRHAVFAL